MRASVLGRIVACAVIASAVDQAQAQFDHRENVNLLNCYNASVSANVSVGGKAPADFVMTGDGSWQNSWSGLGVSDPDSYFTLDFGGPRNVKRVRLAQYNGYHVTNFEVRTSSNGVDFSAPVANSYTDSSGNGDLVLNAAVETRYLRITGVGYVQVAQPRRWLLNNMRAFGDTGVLAPAGKDIDLVSSTGLADGDANPGTPTVEMTLNPVDGIARESATLAQWVDDANSPIIRQVIYSLGTGEGFTLSFDRVFMFTRFGFYTPSQNDPNADYKVEVSMDNATWGTPVLTQTSMPAGVKILALTPKQGRYVRFTFTDIVANTTYINDIMVFGYPPPPPGVLVLLH